MGRVAIIGAASWIGLELIQTLEGDPNVEGIIAIDDTAPQINASKLQVFEVRSGQDLGEIFLESWVDGVIYLANNPGRALGKHDKQLADLDAVLSACHRAGVAGLVVAGSGRVYGPDWERPSPRSEDSPFGGESLPFKGLQGLVAVERRLMTFAAEHPEVHCAMARPATVLSSGGQGLLKRVLTRKPIVVLPSPMAPIQVCHGVDFARALCHLLNREAKGAWNVAPSDVLGPGDLRRLFSRPPVFLPYSLLTRGMKLRGSLGIRGESKGLEALHFLSAPWLVEGRKLREQLSFQFLYSSRDALVDFLSDDAGGEQSRRFLAAGFFARLKKGGVRQI